MSFLGDVVDWFRDGSHWSGEDGVIHRLAEHVQISLVAYTLLILIRNIVAGLRAVPPEVQEAAEGMGYRPVRRFLTVELPLAVPVLAAGVRVASVSNISLVSVGALIGVGGLGQLFTQGFQERYNAPIIVGIALTLVLAFVVDALLVVLRNVLTPWQPRQTKKDRAKKDRAEKDRAEKDRTAGSPVGGQA